MNDILNMTATKNYSLTVGHIRMVEMMAVQLNISQGEVVRRAIDLLFEHVQASKQALNPSSPQS